MVWTGEAVVALLRLVIAERPGRFELEHDGLRIVVESDAVTGDATGAGSSAGGASGAVDRAAGSAADAERPPSGRASSDAEDAPGLAVRATLTGHFYRRPEPSAPPFIDVGDTVAVGDTIGLIEVMKVFSAVTAPAAGRIAGPIAGDGDLVTVDQVLLRILPDGDGAP